jgi:hypothetical protein
MNETTTYALNPIEITCVPSVHGRDDTSKWELSPGAQWGTTQKPI